MDFETTLNVARRDAPAQIPAGWSQGRATFGGMVAAVLYQPLESALEQACGDTAAQTYLRSLTFSFVAPAAAGPLDTSVRVLRAGRSAVQLEAHASQGEQVTTAVLASFGKPRESAVSVGTGAAPEFPAPEACEALPYIEGLVPEFTQHFEYRLGEGAMPFTGSDEGRIGGWIRFKSDNSAHVSTGHLLALIDAWPPAVLSLVTTLSPASTLTWTVELMPAAHDLEANSNDWWQYLAEVEQAEDGYAVIGARLWDARGRLIALSRQTVTIFG
ncbi:acyl-CoA thioesterase II [Microbulbifer agarilyticus]|uniref:Acyl-CoA thioesterase II n=1 Tax=Microbulbifer agarilyticus TaxID=260552 RepID=A0A1Q2M8L4_9GAMM|nr:thioesterase family protein [Microbulbifer agarilyticus]AQQ68562.1 acyl-CoA thioesterase II [Microbulbifer agarilyticus]